MMRCIEKSEKSEKSMKIIEYLKQNPKCTVKFLKITVGLWKWRKRINTDPEQNT